MENEKFQELVLQQLNVLTKEQKAMGKGQQEIRKDINKLENRMESVEKGQLRIETRMENEVIDKIRVLFDSHQAHEEKLDSIEINTGYLVSRVSSLEKIAK